MNISDKYITIAHNTIFLYLRMIILMGISLLTVRVIYNVLGVNDYGTYNIVAGIVIFLSFINNGLSSATKKYITSSIAKDDISEGKGIFNICIQSHAIIALIVFIIMETIGLWMINSYLNIPENRIYAANIVYQLSIFTAIIGILQTPYTTVIISYERMHIYAYLSILDATLKLVNVYLLKNIEYDKLILYSILLFIVSIINALIYIIYANYKFEICSFKFIFNKRLLKEMLAWTKWSVLGQLSLVGSNQGISILVNIFFNVFVNAAIGICNSMSNMVNSFVNNFQIAFNPQIIKAYTNNDSSYLNNLVIRSSQLSSYLVILLFVPLFIDIKDILNLWLDGYPEYTIEFCRFTLISMYIDAIAAPLWMVVYSQNEIKKYQIIISIVYSQCFFLSWIALLFGFAPYSVAIVRIIVFIGLLIVRLYYTRYYFNDFMLKEWCKMNLLKSTCILIVSMLITMILARIINVTPILHIIIVVLISSSCSAIMILIFGFKKKERTRIYSYFRYKLVSR